MDINQITELLNNLLSQTNKKSELKVFNCFIRTLDSVKKKDLSKQQLQLIKENLTSLKLRSNTENKRKFYKQKHAEFKAFLKKEFYFTPHNYHTEMGMIYGMSIGTGLGISLGVAINPSYGISFGIPIGTAIGMVIGMMFGAQKDAEAKKLDRVI